MDERDDKLKIALIAPPWLGLYRACYFGIENMVYNLAVGLSEQGHEVELFTVGTSKVNVSKTHYYHKENQYEHIHKPYYHTSSIIVSHILFALKIIREAGDFDVIHDHNNFIGPGMLAYLEDGFPPVLHTLHQPFSDERLIGKGFPDNRHMFNELNNVRNLYFNPISQEQRSTAPDELEGRMVETVYNGIELEDYEFSDEKDDFFLHMGSLKEDKGTADAMRMATERRKKLVVAGALAGSIDSPKELEKQLKKTDHKYEADEDFMYFKEKAAKYLKKKYVSYVGVARDANKTNLLKKAKALLVPIQWEEPFGIINIEALAAGTPIIGYRRGALPEIVEHGVNGFLADNEEEFLEYMDRVDEIDPAKCRESVEEKFSSQKMVLNYIHAYWQVIARSTRRQNGINGDSN